MNTNVSNLFSSNVTVGQIIMVVPLLAAALGAFATFILSNKEAVKLVEDRVTRIEERQTVGYKRIESIEARQQATETLVTSTQINIGQINVKLDYIAIQLSVINANTTKQPAMHQ